MLRARTRRNAMLLAKRATRLAAAGLAAIGLAATVPQQAHAQAQAPANVLRVVPGRRSSSPASTA
jgi:hypothetical protein